MRLYIEQFTYVPPRKQESRDLEFEAMFCHHCDDSLAGHRSIKVTSKSSFLKGLIFLNYVKVWIEALRIED